MVLGRALQPEKPVHASVVIESVGARLRSVTRARPVIIGATISMAVPPAVTVPFAYDRNGGTDGAGSSEQHGCQLAIIAGPPQCLPQSCLRPSTLW